MLLGPCLAPAVGAHPHAWINVHSTVTASGGLVTAIRQEWIFDELYTAALADAMASGDRPKADGVARFAAEVIENLGPYGYFMKIRADGKRVATAPVTQYRGQMRGSRFVLQFTAPLARPVDPVRQRLQFSVYDPTYFIEMTHDPKAPPSVGGRAPGCALEVHKSRPGAAAIARAFAMDKDAQEDDTLGEMFAEKVLMVCR